jgi:hypothetical protein
MPGIKDYSTTPASNTALFPEGMAPSAVNDGMRQVQADLRSWYNDAQWIVYGDGDGAFTIAYVSPTSFSVNGADVTAVYHAGRRVKASGTLTGTIYGTIASSAFATNTTLTVTWDAGSLQNEALTIAIGIVSATNGAMPPAGTTTFGAVQLAAQADVEAGSAALKAVTPAGLAPAAMTWTGPHVFRSADAGADEKAAIDLDRASASPAANDLLMALRWLMRDASGGTDVAAKLVAKLLDPTAGSEDAELSFHSLVNGVLAERMTLGQGLRVGNATGGDPGFGKINAVDIEVNGASIAFAPATEAEMETAVSTSTFSSPARQHFHPGHPKAWCTFDGTATGTNPPIDGYNVGSVQRVATGRYIVNFATPFVDANYAALGMAITNPADPAQQTLVGQDAAGSKTATAFPLRTTLHGVTTTVDRGWVYVAFFGRQ